MRKLWGTGICQRCGKQTEWYDTITEIKDECVVGVGKLTKSVAHYWKIPNEEGYQIEVICESCGHHFKTKEYEEEQV